MTHLSDVVFLAADTIRSRAYAQALSHAGLTVDRILLVRAAGNKRWGQANDIVSGNTDFGSLFVPDLNQDLGATCSKISKNVEILQTASINVPEVVEWLKRYAPKLVIFSGFGGELVQPGVLCAAGPLLHMHSGWLPDYRGSTTLYYSYLNERSAGVSAIFLSEEIDTGRIISRKKYPVPPKRADLDYYYDSVIRADLLVETMGLYDSASGTFKSCVGKQVEAAGRVYYIIHPVLKHLVLNDVNQD
ncbi:MAG: methionyl-tRNA formyltransferase [Alphaproteobacteria bacterium]|nr:methionyl-tRNA formyltransferase [Alphaproteobacteria bacterium]